MRSGRLRDKAIVQRRGTTVTSDGEPDATWTNIATVRCGVRPLLGAEYFSASGEGSKATTEVRMRYQNKLATFSPTDRLSINSILYDVTSVINVHHKNHELVVMCSVVDRDN